MENERYCENEKFHFFRFTQTKRHIFQCSPILSLLLPKSKPVLMMKHAQDFRSDIFGSKLDGREIKRERERESVCVCVCVFVSIRKTLMTRTHTHIKHTHDEPATKSHQLTELYKINRELL